MSNKPTEYSVQQLENQIADTTVEPHVMRRGMMGKNSNGSWYNTSVNTDGSLNVVPNGSEVDNNNSTTTPLLANATFTGTATNVLHFSAITILIHSDVASAENGLTVQFSPDGEDWHNGESYDLPANSTKFFTPPVQATYFRIVYTNGAVDQSIFHIHTILKKSPVKWSSHNLSDNLNDDDDSELVSSVIKLRTAQDNYVSGAATAGGNFKVSIEEVNGSTDFATETTLSSLNNKVITYTEGDTDASITGTAVMWEDRGNILRPSSHIYPLPVDAHFDPGSVDSFGHFITGEVNNQVDIQYYRDTPANLVTVTTGTGGTATSTGGMATYAATTSANSFAKGVTNTTTVYTAGAELYTLFTAGWTGTGSGTSYQRIGLYDDNNGFFLGFEGGTFYATVRKGGSDVGVDKASFSEDPLTGGTSSKFTRNGVPEAINLTRLNVWRIRFGWVGSAPISFEVLSPDGHWVTFHKILQPNLASLPSIEDADLPVTCHVNSGNSGAALTIITNCWAAGTTQSLSRLDSTLTGATIAQLTRSVITGETSAGGGGYVNVKVNPSGSLETNAVISSLPNEGQQTMANSISVAIASNQTAVPISASSLPLPTGAATAALQTQPGVDIGDVTINNAAGAAAVNIQDGGNIITVDGTVTANLAAGTNNIGDVDILSIAAGTNTIGDVGIKPRTTGGLTTYHLVSAASTNATNIKASAGQVFGWYIYNSNAAARKVAFHNTSGTPTAGASIYFTLVIPPTSGANVFSDIGIPFSSGIAITTVTGLDDSDSTGVGLNDLNINIWYS